MLDKTLDKQDKEGKWSASAYSTSVSFEDILERRDKSDDDEYVRITLRQWEDGEVIRKEVIK